MDKFGDNITDMYVSTLTGDEVVYAGGTGDNNDQYYLINGLNSNFWTLTPSYFYGSYGYDIVHYVNSNGSLSKRDVPYEQYTGFRPAIQLKAGITISGGEGTKANPYVIN